MQTQQPGTKCLQRRIVGFYCFVLAIILMANQVASIKTSTISERPICSISDKKEERGFHFNEMLFSIKGFSLFDMEDVESH
jgi:hypothetical protein